MLLHLTRKERDDKYDSNQLRTEPWRPNQDDRRVSKMLWSMYNMAMMLSVLYILVLFGVAVFVENDIVMCTMFL